MFSSVLVMDHDKHKRDKKRRESHIFRRKSLKKNPNQSQPISYYNKTRFQAKDQLTLPVTLYNDQASEKIESDRPFLRSPRPVREYCPSPSTCPPKQSNLAFSFGEVSSAYAKTTDINKRISVSTSKNIDTESPMPAILEEETPRHNSEELPDDVISPQNAGFLKSNKIPIFRPTKKYCFCIPRRSNNILPLNKRQSIFDSATNKGTRTKIRQQWKSIIHKVILINRVFFTLKQINRDIKYYGATNKLTEAKRKEKERGNVKKKQKACCILLPEAKFKLFWSLVMIVLLIFTMVYVPYRTAFIDDPPFGTLVMEYVMDCLFGLDIILTFFTAYLDENDVLVTNHCKIAKTYLKGWFALDVIATFPFSLLEGSGSGDSNQYNKLLRLGRLPRLYRLMRILRLLKMIRLLKYSKFYEKISFYLQMNQGIVRLIKAFFSMLFFIHFYGCAWFFFAKLADFNPDTWVVRYNLIDSHHFEQYIASVYWVLTTATTVGYGDIYPISKTERSLAICLMIFGVGFYSYTVGNLSSILANMDQRNQRLITQLFSLNEIAKSAGLPDNLVAKIKKNLTANNDARYMSSLDTEELLDELPTGLRTQVTMYMHKQTLNKICFFWHKDPAFLSEIVSIIKKMTIPEGELVYKINDPTDEVYFIAKGRVRMVDKEGYIYRTYVEGSFFGEFEVLNRRQVRNHYAIAHEESELVIIKKNELLDILGKYHEINTEFDLMAKQRQVTNKHAILLAHKGELRLDTLEFDAIRESGSFALGPMSPRQQDSKSRNKHHKKNGSQSDSGSYSSDDNSDSFSSETNFASLNEGESSPKSPRVETPPPPITFQSKRNQKSSFVPKKSTRSNSASSRRSSNNSRNSSNSSSNSNSNSSMSEEEKKEVSPVSNPTVKESTHSLASKNHGTTPTTHQNPKLAVNTQIMNLPPTTEFPSVHQPLHPLQIDPENIIGIKAPETDSEEEMSFSNKYEVETGYFPHIHTEYRQDQEINQPNSLHDIHSNRLQTQPRGKRVKIKGDKGRAKDFNVLKMLKEGGVHDIHDIPNIFGDVQLYRNPEEEEIKNDRTLTDGTPINSISVNTGIDISFNDPNNPITHSQLHH